MVDIIDYSAMKGLRQKIRLTMRPIISQAAARANNLPALFAICDQGVVSLTNFGTGVMIGRICGRAELGAYALAWTILIQATEFSAILTTTPYTVLSPKLDQEQRVLFRGSVLIHQLSISFLFALILGLWACLDTNLGWSSHALTKAIAATGFAIPLVGLREFVRRVSFAELKVGLALVVDVVACLGQAGGLFLLLHFSQLTVGRTYILLGISSALVSTVWLIRHWQGFRINIEACARDWKRNWAFARWVLGSTLLFTFVTYVYPWLLAAFYGTSVAGIWAACAAVVALGNPISLGLTNHVGPKIHNVYAKSGTAAMQRCVYRSTLLFAALLFPILVLLTFGGERIVVAIYGKAYAGTAAIVTMLALSTFSSSVIYPFSRGFFSLNRANVDMWINTASFVVVFTVGVAAVRSYSAVGAAATMLLSSAVAAVLRIVLFTRESRGSELDVPPNIKDFVIEPSGS